MAQLTFEKIINLTEDSSNTEPKLVSKLMIGEEPANDLYQYYIHGSLTKDKQAKVALADYDTLQWGEPLTHLTGMAVSSIGIKTFPQIGAYGFYTKLGESSSKLLLPIHLRNDILYAAPVLSVVDNDTYYTFSFANPADITYACFRLIMQRGKFADEYVSYSLSIDVQKADLNGAYMCYAIGYVGEGQYISEESNIIELTIANPNPPVPAIDKYISELSFGDDNYLNGIYSDGSTVRSSNPAPSGGGVTSPYVRFTSAAEAASSITLTSSVQCAVGDLIVVTAVTRYSIIAPTGWTLLYSSPGIASSSYIQQIYVLYKTAESTSEEITIGQTAAARIYINMHDVVNGTAAHMLAALYQTGSDPGSVPITLNKRSQSLVLFGTHTELWNTAAPYPIWSVTPPRSLIQLGSGAQSRLCTVIDDLPAESLSLSITAANTNSTFECIAIAIDTE